MGHKCCKERGPEIPVEGIAEETSQYGADEPQGRFLFVVPTDPDDTERPGDAEKPAEEATEKPAEDVALEAIALWASRRSANTQTKNEGSGDQIREVVS